MILTLWVTSKNTIRVSANSYGKFGMSPACRGASIVLNSHFRPSSVISPLRAVPAMSNAFA